MPEDLPKAVIVLIWLLSGTIIFGYLLMEFPYIYSFSFVVIFFGGPVLWNAKKKEQEQP